MSISPHAHSQLQRSVMQQQAVPLSTFATRSNGRPGNISLSHPSVGLCSCGFQPTLSSKQQTAQHARWPGHPTNSATPHLKSQALTIPALRHVCRDQVDRDILKTVWRLRVESVLIFLYGENARRGRRIQILHPQKQKLPKYRWYSIDSSPLQARPSAQG